MSKSNITMELNKKDSRKFKSLVELFKKYFNDLPLELQDGLREITNSEVNLVIKPQNNKNKRTEDGTKESTERI